MREGYERLDDLAPHHAASWPEHRTDTPWTGPSKSSSLPVSDIDRAVAFYRDQVGFELDHDTRTDQMHVVQLTPRGSGCSIVFGDLPAQREMAPGLAARLSSSSSPTPRPPARSSSIARVECSEIMVFDDRDGGTFFGFADPDGNTWAVQQIKARAEKPLIPHEARGRFGEGMALDAYPRLMAADLILQLVNDPWTWGRGFAVRLIAWSLLMAFLALLALGVALLWRRVRRRSKVAASSGDEALVVRSVSATPAAR